MQIRTALPNVVLLAGVVALFAFCGGPSVPELPGPVAGANAMAHVEKLVACGVRPPGSENLRKAGDYILGEMQKLGVEATAQEWTEEVVLHGKTLKPNFRNLWAKIPGNDPNAGVLVLGAHYDTKICDGHPTEAHNFEFVGAIDGGGAPGLLVEFARVLKQSPRKETVWLVWFDGEESFEFDWNHRKALYGSRHFVNKLPKTERKKLKTMVLFDLLGDKNIKIDRDVKFGDEKLLDIFRATAVTLNVADRVHRFETQAMDDHIPFRDIGVPVVNLIDFTWRTPTEWSLYDRYPEPRPSHGEFAAWWHTKHDTLDKMSAASLEFVGNLFWAALPKIEAEFFK